MASKFFIYGAGRWRELNTELGTVTGWGRATFVYQRGGRLAVARRRGVLRALRALAHGRGRAASDGLQLSKYMPYPERGIRYWLKRPKSHWRCQSHHTHVVQACIQCDNNSNFDQLRAPQCTVGVQCVPTAEAAVQVSQGLQATEVARAASPKPARAGTSGGGVQVDSSQSLLMPPKHKKAKFAERLPHLRTCSEDAKSSMTSRNAVQLVTDVTKTPAPGEKSDCSQSSRTRIVDCVCSVYANKKIDAYKELKVKEDDVQLLHRFLKKNSFGVDLPRFENERKYRVQVLCSINPLVMVERCQRIDCALREERAVATRLPLKRFMSMLGLQTVGERGAARARYSMRARTAHAHTHTNTNTAARRPAGDDKENEAERCAARSSHIRAAAVLREDNLTLNRARAARPPPSKRLRRNLQRPAEVIDICDSTSEDSSNEDSSSKSKNMEKKEEMQTSQVNGGGSERIILDKRTGWSDDGERQSQPDDGQRQRRAGDREPKSRADDRDRTSGGDDVKRPVVRDVGGGAGGREGGGTRGSGSGNKKNREYSVQEDSAIVSWLRQGGRARLVNGNRLWRELQQEHAARTGIVRSWHSLRNRYLRYILPTLPRFTSPQEAVRLRAAASAGELKSRKQSHENSLLALAPVRSAWAQRRAAAPSVSPATSSTPSPEPAPRASTPKPAENTRLAPARTPTYSELTRRFGGAASSSSDEIKSVAEVAAAKTPSRRLRPRALPLTPQPRAEGALRAAPAKRRLYNPKLAG